MVCADLLNGRLADLIIIKRLTKCEKKKFTELDLSKLLLLNHNAAIK